MDDYVHFADFTTKIALMRRLDGHLPGAETNGQIGIDGSKKRRFYDPIKNDLKFCSPFSSTKKGRSRRIWRRYNEHSSSSSLQSDDQVESGWIEDCNSFCLKLTFL